MRTPRKLSELVARRGFLIGAGVAGAGAALGTGLALPGGSGRAVAATAPPRSALMTAALGTPSTICPTPSAKPGRPAPGSPGPPPTRPPARQRRRRSWCPSWTRCPFPG
ncbi:hypothetical protein V6574_33795 [Streptomyces sp. SM1P]